MTYISNKIIALSVLGASALSLLVPFHTNAAPFDWFGQQRNSTDTANMVTFVNPGSVDSFIGFKGSNNLVTKWLLGNRLSVSGSSIGVDTTGLATTTDLAGKQDEDICLTELSNMGSLGTPEALVTDGAGNCEPVDADGFKTWAGLATVATTGDYNDLINTPAPGSATWGDITGTLSDQTDLQTVLDDKEDIITGSTSDKFWNGTKNFVSIVANDISDATSTGKSVLTAANAGAARTAIGAGTSSFSGAFTDLTGKPTTLSGYEITDAYPLSGNPSGFLTSVPAQSFASITGKPTTLSGYGITDAYPLSGNPSGFLTGITSGQVTTAAAGAAKIQAVAGYVPAGNYLKIRTANTLLTPTFTYRSGQEVLA